MSGDQILTLFLAVITAIGASLATGLISRPKMKAEAGAANAGGQVAISGDARAWAQQFAEQATAAQTRADASDLRARAAEVKADEAIERCQAIEDKFKLLVDYARSLQAAITDLDGHPPPPPPELIPPL